MDMHTVQLLVLQFLAIVLPVLGLALPGVLKQDKLAPAQNGLIGFVVVLFIATVQAWSAGQLGVDVWLDFPVVAGGMAALLAGPFKDIDIYLKSNVGFTGTSTPPKPEPQPITLPDAATPKG